MTTEELRNLVNKTGNHETPQEPPQPTEGPKSGRLRLALAVGLAVVFGFGLGASGPPEDPVIVETEKVVQVPGPVQIQEVPVPIVSAEQEARLDTFRTQLETLRRERNRLRDETQEQASANEQLRKELAQAQQPINPQPLAEELDCFEDEYVVQVVGDVLPDDGVPPNVDWGYSGDAGLYGCATADDFRSLIGGTQ
jgi:hypothetical protein